MMRSDVQAAQAGQPGQAATPTPKDSWTCDEGGTPLLADERAELVARIRAIPIGQLPDQRARTALIVLAQAGAHLAVYSSTTAEGGDGTTIWLEPAHPSLDGRISCVEWMRIYRQDASERALRQLLPLLWQRRTEQQALAAGQVKVPLIYRTAVWELVHDVKQRVARIWWHMMQAEGMAGVNRCDAIVRDVADSTAMYGQGTDRRDGLAEEAGVRAMDIESQTVTQALHLRLPGLRAGRSVVESTPRMAVSGLPFTDFYRPAGCYLLVFLKDRQHILYVGSASPRSVAQHYRGWSEVIGRRVGGHPNPQLGRAANLCEAVVHAGYELALVHVWLGVSREFERLLKSRHDNAAYCPWCLWWPGPPERPEPSQHTQHVELFAPASETETAPRQPPLFPPASALQFTERYADAYVCVLPKGCGNASPFGLVSEVPPSAGARSHL